MALRLVRAGHGVVGYDPAEGARRAATDRGVQTVGSLAALVEALPVPRAVWLMVPAGEPTGQVIAELTPLLAAGDTIVDGSNGHYRDDVGRAARLAARGLHYLDCGVSGGVWGLTEGYCLMVGGDAAAVARLGSVFAALAPPDGWQHVGPPGSGHYAKMVHNGIEYGLMQAYAEGFELLRASGLGLDVAALARLWTRGSVVRSWLLELTAEVLREDPELAGIKGYVEDSGEGRWAVNEAVARAVPLPVITAALYARFRSREHDTFADRLLAALRRAFGGHAVRR